MDLNYSHSLWFGLKNGQLLAYLRCYILRWRDDLSQEFAACRKVEGAHKYFAFMSEESVDKTCENGSCKPKFKATVITDLRAWFLIMLIYISVFTLSIILIKPNNYIYCRVKYVFNKCIIYDVWIYKRITKWSKWLWWFLVTKM